MRVLSFGCALLSVAACTLFARAAYAQTPVTARVTGTVFDSVAMRPLRGAIVRIVRTDDPSIGRSVITDSAGYFSYDSVPAGIWMATFLHPRLDSLRLEPGIIRLAISTAEAVMMPLSTPSPRALVSAVCGAMDASFGVIIGDVSRADTDAAVANATIQVEWPEWVLQKRKIVTEQLRQTARSDSLGRYTLCAVPSGSTLRAISWSGGDTTGLVEVSIPESGFALQDFALGSVEFVAQTVAPTDAAAPETQRRHGTSKIRGRVTTTDGKPLARAQVRVIGSGVPVLTDSTGSFSINDAAAGTQTIEARAIGFQPFRRSLRLSTSTASEVDLSLAVRGVQLDTVRVVAGRDVPWDVRAIERRWRTGMGKFLDAKAVRERSVVYTTDALRGMAGVYIRQPLGGIGQEVWMRSDTGGECKAMLFVDGLPVDAGNSGQLTVDQFTQPDMVAAIEVYARQTMVPVEYLTMARGCGVVAVWTKYGTGGVPVLPPKSERR
jgi:Carboxypeptidase regulatory-like domain